MYHILFVILIAAAAAFFVWRMKVDPMALAFGSSVVYFIPGISGFAYVAYGRGLGSYSQPIVAGAYASMALVVVFVTAAAVLIDRIPARHQVHIEFDARIPTVLLAFTFASGAVSIYNVGVYYLCLDKAIVLSRIDRFYYYASLSVPFCIAAAYSSASMVDRCPRSNLGVR